MYDFKNVLERADLQYIRALILNDIDEIEKSDLSYGERITQNCKPIYKRLENTFPDSPELDNAVADLSQALIEYENVFTEIGMKVGARILFQLLYQNESTETN